MKVCIQCTSQSATSEVDEEDQLSEGVKFLLEPPWSKNWDHAESVDCEQGIKIEVSWHNRAWALPKNHQLSMPFCQ